MQATAQEKLHQDGSLVSPAIDFFLVGGLSLIIIPILWLFPPDYYGVGLAMFFLSFVINWPHFLHSYQIMYSDFKRKCAPGFYPVTLRYRFIFAAVVAPAALVVYFIWSFYSGRGGFLSQALSFMVLTVGWHYAKQGYGMLIVLSVLKKVYYNAIEKKVFLFNVYVMWAVFWVHWNRMNACTPLWGGASFDTILLPEAVWTVLAPLSFATTALTAVLLVRKAVREGKIAVNAITGYAVVYLWLWLKYDPLMLFIIPAFHSLQYLPFVWRFKLNEYRHRNNGLNPAAGLGLFIVGGIFLGMLSFQAIPDILDRVLDYDKNVHGPALFVALFTIFINIHHYFMDNVLWRKENADVARYLFNRPAQPA